MLVGKWLGVVLLCVPGLLVTSAQGQEKPRVIIETDLGGDADDQASLVRFLLYANEWDVEAIIADRSEKAFHKDGARDHLGLRAKDGWEMAGAYLDAYGKVHGNLFKHSRGYPALEYLRQRTVPGFNDTDGGVKKIIEVVDARDPRPVWYCNWGSNSGAVSNLRRALDRVKTERDPKAYARFASRLRIVTLDGDRAPRQGHNEVIPLHVETGYPTMDGGRWYHRFRPLTERAGGFDVSRDVKKGHGALGALYTTPKEGDSWTFIYLIPNGLSDPTEPTWGGWAGRYGPREKPKGSVNPADGRYWGEPFYWANQRDSWQGTTSRDNTMRRWAAQLQNDFKARLDWCVAERLEDANHEPLPHCQGDGSRKVLRIEAKVGMPLRLDATGSTDPDGDALSYRWWVYPEPGSYRGKVEIRDSSKPTAVLEVPADAAEKTIHVILEVSDRGSPVLTRYRRLIVTGR